MWCHPELEFSLTRQSVSWAWRRAAGQWRGKRVAASSLLPPTPPWSCPSAAADSEHTIKHIRFNAAFCQRQKIHHVSKKKKGMFIRHTSDRFYSSVVKKTLLALVFEWHTAIKIHYSLLWFIMMHYECIIWLTMVDIVLMNSFQRNRKFRILHQLSRQSASKAAGSETTIWFTIWNIMINYEYIRRFLLICYNP